MAVPTPVRKRHEPPVLPDTLNSGSLQPENKKAKTSGENEKDAAQPVTPKQGEQEPSTLEDAEGATAGKRMHPIGMTHRQAQWFDIKFVHQKSQMFLPIWFECWGPHCMGTIC